MKRIFSIHNIFLMLVVVLIVVLSLNLKEVKAAGTITWSGPSSITIRETIRNIANPIVASREYGLFASGDDTTPVSTATINYTASDTPTNYQITKSTTMNLSSLTFSKPGDYEYYLVPDDLFDSNNYSIDAYFAPDDYFNYFVVVQVRNVVDANNVPTGNFTATIILYSCEYNEQTDEELCTKVNPVSGVLYADHYLETNPEGFGHIEVSKTVKGIGADTTEYFPVTISIDNDTGDDESDYMSIDSSGWTYPISGLDATVTYNGSTVNNPSTITDGIPTTIYIKHGQTAIIGQISSRGDTFDAIPVKYRSSLLPLDPNPGPGGGIIDASNYRANPITPKKMININGDDLFGSYFTAVEMPGSYSPSYSIDGEAAETGYSVPATEIASGANTVDFYNTKEMSPVTGLIFTILPYVILAGIGIGGALLVMHLKKEERKVKE